MVMSERWPLLETGPGGVDTNPCRAARERAWCPRTLAAAVPQAWATVLLTATQTCFAE